MSVKKTLAVLVSVLGASGPGSAVLGAGISGTGAPATSIQDNGQPGATPAPVTDQPDRKPEGFVIFESEITSRAGAVLMEISVEARIPLHSEGDEPPYGEADLTLTSFRFVPPPAPVPIFPQFEFGAVGRMAAQGAIHKPEDRLDLLLRQLPEISLVTMVPNYPGGMGMPASVPFYYAPFVSGHSGALGGERTILAPPLCRMPLDTAAVVDGAQDEPPGMPGPPSGGMPMMPGMGGWAGMPTGSSINPVCLAITGWRRLDSGSDPTEKTWVKEFSRSFSEKPARWTEKTKIVASTCTPFGMPIGSGNGNPWADDEFLIDPVRQEILYMSKEELLADENAQEELWQTALDGVDDQTTFGKKILSDTGSSGSVVSIPKRSTKDAFIEGVAAKLDRNKYSTVGEMDDIIRGRFNLESREAAMAAARATAIQQDYAVKVDAIELPRRLTEQSLCPCGFGYGYPRYHVIVRAKPDGLTHEWQIGTKTVSKLYETEGIKVPDPMKKDVADGLIRSDLHDIEYDIFRACVKEGELSDDGDGDFERLGLAEFGKALDQVSAAADCLDDGYKDLAAEIPRLHAEAAPLLQKVIDEFGYEAVKEKCFH